jgi:hypothetical protein
VHENIWSAGALDKSVALARVEPFDRAGNAFVHFFASPVEWKKKGWVVWLAWSNINSWFPANAQVLTENTGHQDVPVRPVPNEYLIEHTCHKLKVFY